MSALIAWALRMMAFVTMLVDRDGTDELKAEVKKLKEQLKASLPKKDDGTPWTDEDLAKLKAEHDAVTAEIRDRHDG